MATSLASRKPVDRLTVQDLEAFPIWEFADDEEHIESRDETWVRPVDAKVIGKGADSLSVAADFQTASGKAFRGMVGVSVVADVEFGPGALLVNGSYVFVPADHWSGDPARKKLVEALGLAESQVFPLHFTLRVPIDGERAPRTGVFR